MNKLSMALFALGLAACGTRGESWTKPLSVEGPLVAGGELVYLQRNAAMVVVLDPTGTRAPLHVPVASPPRAFGTTATAVLVAGGRGDGPLLDVVALPAGETRRLALPGAYDRIAASPDGRFAVLTYDPSVAPAPGGPAARNNDEIAIVDLSAGTARALALRTESLAPQQVVFSPGAPLAAVVFDGAVAFVDLADPTSHVVVPLKLSGGTTLHPQQAFFTADGAWLFVRATGSDDVLALEVTRTAGVLSSAINFLFAPGATGLLDITVPAGAGFEHTVAALYSGSTGTTAALLDATGDASRTHTAAFTRPATTLVDLGDGKLLLCGVPSRTSAERTRALAGWEPLLDRVDEDLLPGAVQAAPLFGRGAGYFAHASVGTAAGTQTALTQVSLEDDGERLRVRLAPFVLGGPVTAGVVDPATGSLFVTARLARKESGAAPRPGTTDDTSGMVGSLVALRPGEAAPAGMAFDAEVEALGLVGGRLYAVHPDPLGDVTFADPTTLDRATARRVTGFLSTGLLDQGEK